VSNAGRVKAMSGLEDPKKITKTESLFAQNMPGMTSHANELRCIGGFLVNAYRSWLFEDHQFINIS
jgi:hypothetical protein